MISEYKRLLETIKNNHIVNNTYSGNITYIEIRK
jgi:hypothetical protein